MLSVPRGKSAGRLTRALQAFLVERRLLREHLPGPGDAAQAQSECLLLRPALRQRVLTIRCAARQSNQARLVNDLIAGTVGGLVGTVINTP